MTELRRLDLVVLAAAAHEIVEQADYYNEVSGDALAQRWKIAVHDTVQSLRVMPHRGVPYTFLSSPLNSLRRVPVRGFERLLIFYRADSDAQVLTVVAVLHTSRDIARILNQPRT